MFCPKCGADCGDKGRCPMCQEDVQLPPLGRIEGVDGYVDVSYYTMTLCKQTPDGRVESVFSYRDITQIGLRLAVDGQNGYLIVGNPTDINNELDAMFCETAILFEMKDNPAFYELYSYLFPFAQYAKQRKPEPKRDFCPRCGSGSIMHRRVSVPVFACLPYSFICRSCGYYWEL